MPETTPESEVIKEMETPVELDQDEMTSGRYEYDLPRNDEADSSGGDTAVDSADDESAAPEEDSQSEIPGDPRDPHQTQPPTKDEY